jgi:hypothetical protein
MQPKKILSFHFDDSLISLKLPVADCFLPKLFQLSLIKALVFLLQSFFDPHLIPQEPLESYSQRLTINLEKGLSDCFLSL